MARKAQAKDSLPAEAARETATAKPDAPPPMPLAPLMAEMGNRIVQLEDAERRAAEQLLLIRGRLAEARDALAHIQAKVSGATGA